MTLNDHRSIELTYRNNMNNIIDEITINHIKTEREMEKKEPAEVRQELINLKQSLENRYQFLKRNGGEFDFDPILFDYVKYNLVNCVLNYYPLNKFKTFISKIDNVWIDTETHDITEKLVNYFNMHATGDLYLKEKQN